MLKKIKIKNLCSLVDDTTKQDMYIIGLQQGAQTNIDTFSSFTASILVINVKNIQKNYNQGNVCSPVRQHRHT